MVKIDAADLEIISLS